MSRSPAPTSEPVPIIVNIEFFGKQVEMMTTIDIQLLDNLSTEHRDLLFMSMAKDYFMQKAKITWDVVE